jgi:hypothetical protein
MATSTPRFVLRDLPLAARLVLAAFLISVGLGYVSALVQLHFQHATAGKVLPELDDTVKAYHGMPGVSQFERLLEADENKPFNGSGTMRPAFTTRSAPSWERNINKLAKDKNIKRREAETILRGQREGERQALLEWVRAGADRKSFEENSFPLPPSWGDRPITPDMVDTGPGNQRIVRIATIVEKRCARCHSENVSNVANQYPLDTYDDVQIYCEVKTTGGGMSLKKLAQSTHAHLLSFAVLYGMTGLIFAFTSFPGLLRGFLGPLPLVAQVVDVGCWWLARLDPMYAKAIVFTGAIVAISLLLQILLTLFNLFGRVGKTVLFLLLLASVLWGYLLNEKVVTPYLQREGVTSIAPAE